MHFYEDIRFYFIKSNDTNITLGKSAPRKLRKSRINQANAIEQENDENILKCIGEDVLAEDEDSEEGKNINCIG